MGITVSVAVFVLFAVALIGIFIPFIPGLVLAWLGFVIYLVTQHIVADHIVLLIIMTLLTVVALFSDTLFSIIGAKVYDSSKYGIMGGVVGFFVGLFLFPPFGAIVGPFAGVYLGEIAGGKTPKVAARSFLGSVIGFLVSMGLKLIVWVALLISLLYIVVTF